VVALAWLAHGGVYGAVAEGAIALAIAGLFLFVWLRERRRGDRPVAELRDDD
jgi:uncharacterized protein (TIGR03382 family)